MRPDLSGLNIHDDVAAHSPAMFTKEPDKSAQQWGDEPGEPVIETADNVPLRHCYHHKNIVKFDHLEQVAGCAPYMRGPYTTMYRRHPWTVRQDLRFSSVEETNIHWRRLLTMGTRGFALSFDIATHKGADSDNPAVLTRDIGYGGVAMDSVADMNILFEGIAIDKVSVSFIMNSAVLPVLAFYIVAAEQQGLALPALSGTIQNDILGELVTDKRHIFPPHASMRIATDILKYTTLHMPKFHPICISGHPLREAGGSVAMELAFTMASGLSYLREGLAAGLDLDSFAPRVSFSFGVGMNCLVEVAKMRAARMIWAKLVKGLGAKDSRSLALRIHSQTLQMGLSANHPLSNVVRTTVQAMAAVLGQTQSLYTSAMDVLSGDTKEAAARLAENTQIYLAREAGLANTIDPLGGAYGIETLTMEIAHKAWEHLSEIEDLGGMVTAIDLGLPKMRIEESAERRQARMDAGLDRVVGAKRYRDLLHDYEHIHTEESGVLRERQLEKLRGLKARRVQKEVDVALKALSACAKKSDGNLLEYAIVAARKGATLGEINSALSLVFGKFKASQPSVLGADSAQMGSNDSMQQTCQMVQEFVVRTGRRPRLTLAKLGREGYERLLKGIALTYASFGFDVDASALFDDPTKIVKQAIENDAHVIGVSFLSSEYRNLVPALIAELRSQQREDILVVAGGVMGAEDIDFLLGVGVFAVFGPGTVMPECAQEILKALMTQEEA